MCQHDVTMSISGSPLTRYHYLVLRVVLLISFKPLSHRNGHDSGIVIQNIHENLSNALSTKINRYYNTGKEFLGYTKEINFVWINFFSKAYNNTVLQI